MPASIIPVTGLILGPVGSFSQTDFPRVSPRLIDPADVLYPSFGDLMVLNQGGSGNNTYSALKQYISIDSSSLTASVPLCLAAANVKTNTVYPSNGSGSISNTGVYLPGQEADALLQGTMNVAVNVGTPAGAGSQVYIRKILNASFPLGVIGGIEGVADGSNTVAYPNIVFRTGILSTDPSTGQVTAQVVILNRQVP